MQKERVTMRISPERCAAVFATGIVLLTGCSGFNSVSTPNAGRQNQARTIKDGTRSCPCLYVANNGGGPSGAGSVTVYPSGAMGNAKPIQVIAGSNTGLTEPEDVAVDASGNMYVSNDGNNSVTVYAAGATGNVAPMQTITGSYTGLSSPFGVAIDPLNENIYVANKSGKSITAYAPGSTGNTAPIATLKGRDTLLDKPAGLAFDAKGDLYATVLEFGLICIFAPGSTGDASPIGGFGGRGSKLSVPYAVALDASSSAYVANDQVYEDHDSLLVYAAGTNVPVRRIKGRGTQLRFPDGIAVDGSGNIYAADHNYDRITVYAAGSNGAAAPDRILRGSRTGIVRPAGIVIR
jgi:sugar lactone lactonase YvrE